MFVYVRKSIQLALLCGACLTFDGRPANAQMQENCSPVYEAIIPLRNPDFNNLFEWRRVVGRTGYDWINNYVGLDDGFALTVGIASEDIHAEDAVRRLSIVRYDADGQIVRERQVDVDALDDVVATLRDGESIFVGANFVGADDQKYLQILRMNFDGEEIKPFILKENNEDLVLSDMVYDSEGRITLAVKRTKHDGKDESSTVFYTLDKRTEILYQREYMPGTSNHLVSVGVNEDGSYMGAGAVEVGRTLDGAVREGGWIVNLDKKGAVYWQKPYARGAKAELARARIYGDVGVVSVGTAWPSIEIAAAKHSSLWVMLTDTTGEPKWQRFITGSDQYSYSAVDMHLYEDGRITVLANAIALVPSEKVRSHIRLITFSPQGTIIQDQAFVEGAEAMARALYVLDDGSFRITGQLYTGYAPRSEAMKEMLMTRAVEVDDEEMAEENAAGEEKSAFDQLRETTLENSYYDSMDSDKRDESATLAPVIRGWLLAVAAAQGYNNPCR